MAVLFSDRMHGDPRIMIAGTRAVGAWVMMLSWLSNWPEENAIHPGCRRMFAAKPKDIRDLINADLLAESENGWIPLGEGELWKFQRPTPSRSKIPADLRALVMERDERACRQCGRTDDLTLDHIIPWSHGGPDTEENLRVLCRPCNSSRGNRVELVNG